MASPVTSRGSHSCFCSTLPAWASAPPERIELTKWGDGANDLPNSSYTTTDSNAVIPEPPYSSGSWRPIRSRWASCFQSSGE